MELYHVVGDAWQEGDDLLPLTQLHEYSDALAAQIEQRWPEAGDPAFYYATDGEYVHLFEQLEDAQWLAGELGGRILAIDADAIGHNLQQIGDLGQGETHPAVCGVIPAAAILQVIPA